MAEIRKDGYINDKFVLIPTLENKNDNLFGKINNKSDKQNDENNCSYCNKNGKISDQLILSFVFKDGILQRLYNSDDSLWLKIGLLEYMNAKIL